MQAEVFSRTREGRHAGDGIAANGSSTMTAVRLLAAPDWGLTGILAKRLNGRERDPGGIMTEVLPETRGSLTEAHRVRGPAHAAMIECLRIQASARRPSLLARLFGQDPILPDARAWYRGALGEIHVAKVLKELGADWTVLHAVDPEEQASDLIVGPAGVFLIATKNHSRQRVWVDDKQLLVNGHRTHHLRDARYEADRVSALLGVPVVAVLAIVDPASLALKGRPEGVEVLAASQLAGFLTRRKRRLTDAAVTELLVAAGVHGSWSAHVLDETLRHETRFARVRAQVDAAARRRIAWVVTASILGAAFVVLAVALG